MTQIERIDTDILRVGIRYSISLTQMAWSSAMVEQADGTQPKLKWKLSLAQLAVIALIVAGLVAVFDTAVQNVPKPKGPYGRMIPNKPPDEGNRITHESGLSIIAPENWDADPAPGALEPSICIHARVPGMRTRSMIEVKKVEPFDADCFQNMNLLRNMRKFEFQGNEAYEKTETLRKGSFDDPAWSEHTIYVNHDGQWWLIATHIAEEIEELPEEFRPYLETIRFPDLEVPVEEPASGEE
jgi:hypothetical protein